MRTYFLPVFSVLLMIFCAACEGESDAAAATTTSNDTDEFWAVDAGGADDTAPEDTAGVASGGDPQKL